MMLELMEKIFADLNALGYADVRARLDRGEHLGDPDLVREWLEVNAPKQPQTPVASAINPRHAR